MKRAILLLALVMVLAAPLRAQPKDELLVFATASLTDAMRDVDLAWQARGGVRLRFNFAASSTLARQLEQGAGAHVFAAADLRWMDWAQQRNLIAVDTRRILLGNRLVLIGPRGQTPSVLISPALDLLALLGPRGRLAVGDPAHVPAGTYARQALTRLGLWAAVESRLARADNVRGALLLVERGEAPLGIVYATDAAVAKGVAVMGVFPAEATDPIAYPFAVTRAGDTPLARDFMTFLAGPEAAEIFSRRGFVTE